MKLKVFLCLVFVVINNFLLQGQTLVEKKPIVAMHLLNYTSDTKLLQLQSLIPDYAAKGINLIVLEVDYNFEFSSHPELIQSENYITFAGARKFAKHCKQYGIRIIPQFQSLGHQSWAKNTFALLTKYPELDLTPGAFPNNEGLYCREWDVMNPKVNEIVFPLIDEIVTAFQADGIHLGMDEVFLLGSEKSPSTKGKDPAVLYAKVINDFHNYFVKNKKIEMFMWGDRLIDGKKHTYGEWESSLNGTAGALDMIPKDIIICDWHYELRDSYSSIPMFLEKGFRVLPCSYVNPEAAKALIKYSLRQENDKMLGHLFTSWNSIPEDSLLLYPAFIKGLELMKTKAIWDVAISSQAVSDGTLRITLDAGKKDLAIYYTMDNKDPNKESIRYTTPFTLSKSDTIKAIVYMGDVALGEIFSKSFRVHLATGRPVKLNVAPSSKYVPLEGAQVLVNGVELSKSFSDGQWAGFEGQNVEAVVDLGAVKQIRWIDLHFYDQPASWIYPSIPELWVSVDGINFRKIEGVEVDYHIGRPTYWSPWSLSTETKASHVKLIIPKVLIPANASVGAGLPAWVFIDEIVVR
jgi:hypothetical protein